MRRRSRSLTLDERRLWAQVAQSVIPFAGRAIDKELAPEAPPADDGATIGSPVRPQASEPLHPGRLQPLVPLERRTVSALRRGKQGIEAVVDLHGLRQSEAHRMLRGFLHRSARRRP